jgi:large conductance mechanosensitive channel
MLKEFKAFILKGNMIDMAIGIIIGAAFGTLANSFVNDIMMPVLAALVKAPDFSNLFVVLQSPADTSGVNMSSIQAVRDAGGVALGYGLFINALISLTMIGLALFFLVKAINKMRKEAEPQAPTAPAGPTAEELLAEIRDLLKKS